jgi:hypothetical protein
MNQNWADRLPPNVLVKWRALWKETQTTMLRNPEVELHFVRDALLLGSGALPEAL